MNKTVIILVVVAAVVYYLYNNLTLEVETTDANVNSLAKLPVKLPLKKFFSNDRASQSFIHARLTV